MTDEPCPACGGKDPKRLGPPVCPACKGWGKRRFTSCPMKLVGDQAWDAWAATRRAESNCWPVAGGWLDQSLFCLDAVDVVAAAKADARPQHPD